MHEQAFLSRVTKQLLLILLTIVVVPSWGMAEEAVFLTVNRIEKIQKDRPLSSKERHIISSLYILQGNCTKLRKLYQDKREPQVPLSPDDTDRLCACDGRCDILTVSSGGGRMQQALYVFRQMLGSGRSLSDPQVKALWARLNQHPESKYLVFKRFAKSTVGAERELAARSWKDLSKFNLRLK